LVIRDDNFNTFGIFIENNLGNFSRLKRIDDEGSRIRRPRNDVDLLALQFADDGLNAGAAHADAGADRIDGSVTRDDRDLGAGTRIAGNRLDFDDAVVNFRHFHGEKLRHEGRMGTRQENLRTALFATHVVDIGANAIAVTESFTRDQFVTTHDGFATTQINDHIAVFDALHSTVDDFADTVLVFVILAVTLGFAHFLHDDLLCRLRGDTAEIHRRKLVSDEIANLCVRVAITGGEERNLRRVILDVFNDFEQALQLDLTGLRIDVRANVAFLAVTRTRRLLDRIGHGRKNDLAVD